MKGILNLNKPKGISSGAAVSKVKRILGTGAVGHMGTLDPMAEGVLLIGVGKATRLFDYYLAKNKTYLTDFTFGHTTDTLDSEGVIIHSGGIIPSENEIIRLLGGFIGEFNQQPPQYSAKSVGGVRAYALARKGIEVQLKPSKISIYSLDLVAAAPPVFTLRLSCSSGTYVRSICRDLASAASTYAVMTSLTRLSCGEYCLQDALTLNQLENMKESALTSVESALSRLTRYDLPLSMKRDLDNGIKIYLNDLPQNDFALYCNNILYGIAENNNGRLKIKAYLKD